eukprot:1253781-Rhodomonas_salina.2
MFRRLPKSPLANVSNVRVVKSHASSRGLRTVCTEKCFDFAAAGTESGCAATRSTLTTSSRFRSVNCAAKSKSQSKSRGRNQRREETGLVQIGLETHRVVFDSGCLLGVSRFRVVGFESEGCPNDGTESYDVQVGLGYVTGDILKRVYGGTRARTRVRCSPITIGSSSRSECACGETVKRCCPRDHAVERRMGSREKARWKRGKGRRGGGRGRG